MVNTCKNSLFENGSGVASDRFQFALSAGLAQGAGNLQYTLVEKGLFIEIRVTIFFS